MSGRGVEAPVGGEVDDERGGFGLGGVLVDGQERPAGLEPAEAFPVLAGVAFGGEGAEVDGGADALAFEIEALKDVVFVGGHRESVLRAQQDDEAPVAAQVGPDKLRRAETLGAAAGAFGTRDLEFDGELGVAEADAAGAGVGGEVVDEDERQKRLERRLAAELAGQRRLVGVASFPKDGDAGGAVGERADGEALESAFANFAEKRIVLGEDALVADERPQAFGEGGDAAVGEHAYGFEVDGEAGVLKRDAHGAEVVQKHEALRTAGEGEAEVFANGRVVGDEKVLARAEDAGGFADARRLPGKRRGGAESEKFPPGGIHGRA